MIKYGDGQASRIKRVRAAARSGRWLAVLVVVLALGIAGNLAATRVAAAPLALQTEPEADPCAAPQMVVRNAAVNVRQGPDPGYPILLIVRRGDELPVVGRHHGFPWWAVQLPDGRIGWAWSTAVAVTGDIASVPLLAAPELGGQVPDTSSNWTPTIETPCLNQQQVPEDQATPEVSPVPTTVPSGGEESPATLDQGWAVPLNLSGSGGTSNPIMVVEEEQNISVIWHDEYLGSVYRNLSEQSWSAPVTITVPFSETQARLFAGDAGQLHALWIDEDGLLQYGQSLAANLTATEAWTETQVLTGAVLQVQTAVDQRGNFHLAYVRSEATTVEPAGIYYRRSTDGGESWSPATLLYTSPYLRGIPLADGNIQITTDSAGGDVVYVVWDNRARKRIFLARSADGGSTWQEPEEIAGPDSTSSIILPFNVQVAAQDERLLLVWQQGQPGVQCRRFSRWSDDGGESWSEIQQLVDLDPGFASCASENKPLAGDDLFYLWTVIENEIFLQAWNGDKWSEPQPQSALTGFNDPETLNSVILGCFQPEVVGGQRLLLLACGTSGTSGVGDIWFTQRSLETASSWFPPPSAWTLAAVVDVAATEYADLSLVTDPEGKVHALWSTRPAADGIEGILTEGILYYSRRDPEGWLSPVSLFAAAGSPGGPLAAAIGPDGRLFAAWRTLEGMMLFSHVLVEDAALVKEWAPASVLPLSAAGAGDLTLGVDAAGVVSIAYTVPVNEGRALYYIWTEDQGANWSEPVTVLDGEALNWEIVGTPEMTMSGNGTLHFLVAEEQLLPVTGRQATTLYYVRCEKWGAGCNQPEIVGSNPPQWQSLSSAGAGIVHRAWQEQEETLLAVYHAYSSDDGRTWSPASQVTTLVESGPAWMAADVTGGLHLFLDEENGIVPLLWEDGTWRQDQSVPVAAKSPLRAVVSRDGTVTMVLARQVGAAGASEEQSEEEESVNELVVLSRQLELGDALPVPNLLPTPSAVALPAEETPTSAPSPTPPVVLPETNRGGAGESGVPAGTTSNSSIFQIGAGVLPAVLLLAVVLVFGTRSLWLRRR